jgi:hypothetical protein
MPERRPDEKRHDPKTTGMPEAAPDRRLRPQDVLALQSQAGNAAVGRMLNRQPAPQAPPAASAGAAGADVQRDLAKQFLEMGTDAIIRAFPNLMSAAGMLLSYTPGMGPDQSAPLRALATADVMLAKTMLDQAAQMRTAAGLGLGTPGARDVDRKIDTILMELGLGVLPVLQSLLGAGPGMGAPLMQLAQRAFQLVIDLRVQMTLAGIPVPPAPPPGQAPPGQAGPTAS